MRSKINAAFIGFGEVNSPSEIIEKKCKSAKKLLEDHDFKIMSFNIVNDDPSEESINQAIQNLISREFDLIIVTIAGWIPSWAVIKTIYHFKHKPVILWGLSGYYQNGKLMTTADQAGTTALRKVFEDMGFKFKYIYNMMDSKYPIQKILSFARACKAANLLKDSRIGMMGYRDMHLYGTTYDAVSLRRDIGIEIEHFEMLEIVQIAKNINKNEINKELQRIKKEWIFEKPVKDEILITGIKIFLAIAEKIKEKNYQGISLIDVDGMKKLLKFPPAMILTLIADRLGTCVIPENDAPGSTTQLISRYLTGQISAYMEFYEFMKDRILIGVPDFVPSEIVKGKTLFTPTKFGDFEDGVLNISKVKAGPVTLARLALKNNRYVMHVLTGEAIDPREWEEIGWEPPAPQLPGLEILTDIPVDDFAQEVLSQHYIMTYGNNAEIYKDICKILNISFY